MQTLALVRDGRRQKKHASRRAVVSALASASALAAWIALSGNPLPDLGFFFLGHENPVRHLIHGAAAAAADIVEGGRTDRYTRGIGTLRGRI